MSNTIDAKQFEALLDAGAVKAVSVEGTAGGFAIKVDDKVIEARRGNIRVFKKLNTVAVFLRTRGVVSFAVNLNKWAENNRAI